MKAGMIFLGMMVLVAGCTKNKSASQDLSALTPDQLAERGRSVYVASCVSCHGADPKVGGSVGPAIWGSSEELLRHKVLGGPAPAGYVPKRNTAVMPKLPHLEKEIPALKEYLNR